MFEFQTISRPRYLKLEAPFETCLFSEPPSLKWVERRINGNLEQQAAAFFHHQFIANADPSWKEGAISDIGTVIGGSTPSKSNLDYQGTQQRCQMRDISTTVSTCLESVGTMS